MSVVLPAYNEEKNIREAVRRTQAFLRKRFKAYEILVVDDGSTDATAIIVKDMSRSDNRVHLLSHGINRGYGTALRTGFGAAQGRLVFYTDTDNQYDISELDSFFPLLKRFDIVAGYRLKHSDPTMRIIISAVYNLLIRIILGLKIRDVDCSFKLYKRQVFRNITLKCMTGLIDAEVLIKAKKKGFTVTQLGVRHYPRTQGKSIYEIGGRNKFFAMVSPKVPWEIFKEIWRLWPELT